MFFSRAPIRDNWYRFSRGHLSFLDEVYNQQACLKCRIPVSTYKGSLHIVKIV